MSLMLIIIPLTIIGFMFFGKARISLSNTQKAFALYLALLLIAVPVYYVVAEPVEADPSPEPDHPYFDAPFWEEYNRLINEFYEAAFEGRLGDFDGARVAAQRNFEYEGEKILLTAQGSEHYGLLSIVLDRKDVNDGKLEITVYEVWLPYGSTVVTDPQPDFVLEDARLKILQPRAIRVEEIRFHHDFNMAQFSGIRLKTARFISIENKIIHLRIPADLRIETDHTTEYSIIRSPENEK